MLRLASLVCSAQTRVERLLGEGGGCWARAAAQRQRRGQSRAGGERGHSGAGTLMFRRQRAVRLRVMLMVCVSLSLRMGHGGHDG